MATTQAVTADVAQKILTAYKKHLLISIKVCLLSNH